MGKPRGSYEIGLLSSACVIIEEISAFSQITNNMSKQDTPKILSCPVDKEYSCEFIKCLSLRIVKG